MRSKLAVMAAAAALVLSLDAAAWRSQLYTPNAGSSVFVERTVNFAGRAWKLPDHSYVGYRLGAQGLAAGVPCNNISITATGDITSAVQQAVDSLGASGGGMVLIPAGSFTLSRPISIPHSNVAVQGAGSRKTTINVPSTYNSGDGVFTLGKRADEWALGWIDQGTPLTEVTARINRGDKSVTVANAASLRVGQWVMVRQYFWSALSQANSAGAWPSYNGFPGGLNAHRTSMFGYLRQVVAVSGSQATLDAPIPWTLDPANNPVRISDTATPSYFGIRSNIGVAGLSIHFANNTNGGGRPTGAGVHVEGMYDGWIHDVQIRNTPRFGIHLLGAARITVLNSAVFGVQDHGGGGYGYGLYTESSQNLLIRNVRVEDMRQGFTSRDPMTADLVYMQNQSAGARLGDDTHHGLSHNILWDLHQLSYGSNVVSSYRGNNSGEAHETAANFTLWNLNSDGAQADYWGGAALVNPSSSGFGIMVGGPGPLSSVFEMDRNFNPAQQFFANAGLQVATAKEAPAPGSLDQNMLFEGIFRTDALAPSSLLNQQFRQRTGLALPGYAAGTCRANPPRGAWLTGEYPGPGQLIYNGEKLGYGFSAYNCANGCNRDAPTPGGAAGTKSFLMRYSAGGTTLMSILRGRNFNSRTLGTLQLRVRPVGTAIKSLRLELVRHSLPEFGPDASIGSVTATGLVANSWTTVNIPLAQFAPGDFNSLNVFSANGNSTGDVYLDDIVLLPP